jgi:UDP-N-acetylglucosamine 4-epimerase
MLTKLLKCYLNDVDPEINYSSDRKVDISHSLASINEAKNLLGYRPGYNFTDGFKLAVEWYRKNFA